MAGAVRYIFQDILGIREVREDRASRECTARRSAMEQAYAYIDQCQQALDDYREWRIGEKDRLYDQVIGHEVVMPDLDLLKEMLAALDEKEALHMRRLQLAEGAAEDAKKAYEGALGAWRQSQANLQKMQEHKDVWVEEALDEVRRFEEAEMEEHVTKPLGDLGDELEY